MIMSGFPRSVFPPGYPTASTLARQKAMAQARAFDQQVAPDDSASNLGSTASWSVVQGAGQQAASSSMGPDVQVPKAPPPGFGPGETRPYPRSKPTADPQEESDDPPEVPPNVKIPAAAAQGQVFRDAPATQAAKELLNSAQQQTARLERQKARADKRGGRKVTWGQIKPGRDPTNFQLPWFVQQMGAGDNERSVLIVDSRDQRIQSPFQGWLLDEILLNAQAKVNVLSDPKMVRTPTSGYHMNLFYVRILDGYKFILVGSMTSYGSVPCGAWDVPTSSVLDHKAFQPFRWPVMTDKSPTWVDVKVKIEGSLLLHLELRGYRGDQDMTVQLNSLNDAVVDELRDQLFVPSCIVTIFQGWRVVATSFEVGGRIYACAQGGRVVALDFPLCHFELRLTATSSPDSMGMDADRLEFRFRSAQDKLDVACSQMVCPSTWMVCSGVPGQVLVSNAAWCRKNHARVEGPDQVLQLSQLAGIHSHWTASIEGGSADDVGPRVGAVVCDSNASNMHLTCESPLYQAPQAIVPPEALALQFHDFEEEVEAITLPPVTGEAAVVPAQSVTAQLKAITGPIVQPVALDQDREVEVSVTQPGEAPSGVFHGGGSVHVPRRSMTTRKAEEISLAAMTPADFRMKVEGAVSSSSTSLSPGVPITFGPKPVIEEIRETEEV